MLDVNDYVKVSLPGEWGRHALQSGCCYIRDLDLKRAGGNILFAPTYLELVILDPGGVEFSAAMEARLRRRYPYDCPDRTRSSVSGLDAVGFEYTDGVRLTQTFYVTHPSGTIIELSAAVAFGKDGSPEQDIEGLRALLFANVEVSTQFHESATVRR